MATRLVTNVGDSLLFPSNYGYHRKCYQLYTNKKNLDSAKRRSTVVDSRPQKRTQQSKVGLGHVVQKSASVFGKKCIICNKNKYTTTKKNKKNLVLGDKNVYRHVSLKQSKLQ